MSSGSVKRYVTSWPHRGWNFLSLLSQGLWHTWFLKQFSVFLITGNHVGNCPWGLCAMKCGLINLLAQSRLSRASSDNSVLYWVSHWLLLIRRISLSLIFVLHELETLDVSGNVRGCLVPSLPAYGTSHVCVSVCGQGGRGVEVQVIHSWIPRSPSSLPYPWLPFSSSTQGIFNFSGTVEKKICIRKFSFNIIVYKIYELGLSVSWVFTLKTFLSNYLSTWV